MGLNLNANYATMRNKYYFDPFEVDNTDFYDRQHDVSVNSVTPGVIFGYGQHFNGNYYAGLEADISINPIRRATSDEVSSKTVFKLDKIISLIGKLGYTTNYYNLTPYGLIGLQYTQLTRNTVFSPTGDYQLIDLATLNKTNPIYGKIIGIGVEQAYSELIHFGLEYQHIFYNASEFDLKHRVFDFLGDLGTNKISTSQDTISFRVLFYL